jgi:hypothetical protein
MDGLLPANMAALADAGVLRLFRRKLNSLGFQGESELRCLLDKMRLGGRIPRGKDIVRAGDTPGHYYPGDFCDLHRYVKLEAVAEPAVRALTDCSIGTIDYRDLDRAIERYRKLALVLWRATMLESSTLRERLANVSQRPALERVSHLLCEQLHRRRAIGIESGVVPLNQIDLADAAGLSVVHINRVFQDLRKLGVISASGRTIEVVNWERLAEIANFDSRYLTLPAALSSWDIIAE